MRYYDTYGDDKVLYDDDRFGPDVPLPMADDYETLLRLISTDGAGRFCAYRHRHRWRLGAWLCGLRERMRDE